MRYMSFLFPIYLRLLLVLTVPVSTCRYANCGTEARIRAPERRNQRRRRRLFWMPPESQSADSQTVMDAKCNWNACILLTVIAQLTILLWQSSSRQMKPSALRHKKWKEWLLPSTCDEWVLSFSWWQNLIILNSCSFNFMWLHTQFSVFCRTDWSKMSEGRLFTATFDKTQYYIEVNSV